MSYELKVGFHMVNITHPDRILFPKDDYTKAELLEYYLRIWPIMGPLIKNRLLTLVRFPKGITQEGFYQKDAPNYYPSFIKRKNLKRKDGSTIHYMMCNNQASLAYLVNQSTVVFHVWLSKVNKLDYPDRMIFDLDPSKKDDFKNVCEAAKQLKKMLEDLGLNPFVMTTGSRGLHITVPLKPQKDYDFVKNFAQDVARILVDEFPKKLTLEVRKNKRAGRIFIDTLRINFGQTGVAPYSVRSKPGAPIAAPIDWKEVNKSLTPQKFNIKNMFKRLSRKEDPWHDIDKHACSLKKARTLLDEWLEEI